MKIPSDMIVGTIHDAGKYGKLEVVAYSGWPNVLVRFIDTGYEVMASTGNVRGASVKDRLYRSVYGVGFLGVERYGHKPKWIRKKCYQTWTSMISRCYSEFAKENLPHYADCFVCDEWHDFQAFSDWFYRVHPGYPIECDLDKDIKIYGNRIYGPEACLLVSNTENVVKANAKWHSFVSPDGVVFKIYNLRKFCRENNLCQPEMCDVHLGKARQHKGWLKA